MTCWMGQSMTLVLTLDNMMLAGFKVDRHTILFARGKAPIMAVR